jgi:hypothetical protein
MGSAQTLMSLNRPTSAEYTSVENFMNNEKPVPRPQFSFIYRKEDLITLRLGREHAWLDSQVEKLLKACDGRFVQVRFFSHLLGFHGRKKAANGNSMFRKFSHRLSLSRKKGQKPPSRYISTETGSRRAST